MLPIIFINVVLIILVVPLTYFLWYDMVVNTLVWTTQLNLLPFIASCTILFYTSRYFSDYIANSQPRWTEGFFLPHNLKRDFCMKGDLAPYQASFMVLCFDFIFH